MKISIFGAGYVGLVSGTCLAELGNEVTLVDIDKDRIANLNKGIIPIYEPGLSELIRKNVGVNRLDFTLDGAEAVKNSEISFIAVGTPEAEDGSANLEFVFNVADTIADSINDYKVVVIKSTVPPGTCDRVVERILDRNPDADFDVVSNPETLREGNAVRDFMVPDRIIVGADSEKAKETMDKLYGSIARANHPIFFTDVRSSELIKHASNAMLATRISFMNMLAPFCEKIGADVKEVARGIGLDDRIGPRFLQAGAGWGGSCFPKDIRALARTMKSYGCDSSILDAVDDVNEKTKSLVFSRLEEMISNLEGKTVGVWGLAFKPNTDDIRDAPSKILIRKLLDAGVKVRVYDPEAMENMKKVFPEVSYHSNPYLAAEGSDIVVLLTEWNEFRSLDMERVRSIMNEPRILDARNVYEPEDMKVKGFTYKGVGRK